MLPKASRLTTKEIEALSNGTSVFGTLVSLRFISADRTKFSVSVSKKVLPNAVDRNRTRRRVYAAIKGLTMSVAKEASIMVIPKKECLIAPVDDIQTDLIRLFEKARLMR